MVKDFNYFDNLNRSFPYVVLEYALSKTSPPSGHNAVWPYMQGSVAEAVLSELALGVLTKLWTYCKTELCMQST